VQGFTSACNLTSANLTYTLNTRHIQDDQHHGKPPLPAFVSPYTYDTLKRIASAGESGMSNYDDCQAA
jgi:hypothetical protein